MQNLKETIKNVRAGTYLSPSLRQKLPKWQRYVRLVKNRPELSWEDLANILHVRIHTLREWSFRLGYQKPSKLLYPVLRTAIRINQQSYNLQRSGVKWKKWSKQHGLNYYTVQNAVKRFGLLFPTPADIRRDKRVHNCIICKKNKPYSEFYANRHIGGLTKLQTACKSCSRLRLRKYMRIRYQMQKSNYRSK